MLSVASRGFGQVYTCDSKKEYLCSIGGSCLYLDRCVVATREKTAMLSLSIIILFTLHTFLNAIICCLQLNTGGCHGCNSEGGLLIIDAVGLTVYVFCCNTRISFRCVYSYGPSTEALFVNCPAVIRLPSM